MKRYNVTEKQLEQLKKQLEELETAPVKIADDENEMIVAEGGDPIEELFDILNRAIAEPLRELKYLVEDVERQEVRDGEIPHSLRRPSLA